MDTIRLSPEDNIVVLARSVAAGKTVMLGNHPFKMSHALGLGHKLAARDIRAGEKILKYRVPIGSATEAISAGAHVHLHNLQSDYLPTYTLGQGREFHPTP